MPATEAAVSDYERERGKPIPSRVHGLTQTNISNALAPYHLSEYIVYCELTLELDGNETTPDLSIFPFTPADYLHDEVRVTEPPLVAVEIASPTQSTQALVDKIQGLIEAGVRSCWLVQSTLRTLTVFGEDMQPNTFSEGTVTDPATGIEIALKDVFQSAKA